MRLQPRLRRLMGSVVVMAVTAVLGSGLATQAAPPVGLAAREVAAEDAGVGQLLDALEGNPKIQRFVTSTWALPDTMSLLKRAPASLRVGQTGTDRLQVVIEGRTPDDVPALRRAVVALGGEVQLDYDASLQAVVPLKALTTLAEMEAVTFVRLPVGAMAKQSKQESVNSNSGNRVISEGVAQLGAGAWHDAGFDGAGVNVAILDQGFLRFEDLLDGELPPASRVSPQSFAANGLMFNPDIEEEFALHGTAVSEIIHDMAPGASLTLARFETDVELRRAINGLVNQDNVDVINSSIGLFSGCQSDVTKSLLEPAITRTVDSGITWVTAASNEGDRQHLRGHFKDEDGDGFHEFAPGDTTLSLDFHMINDGGSPRQAVGFALIDLGWSADCTRAPDAYDLTATVAEGAPQSALDGLQVITDWLWRPGFPDKIALVAVVSRDTSLIGTRQTVNLSLQKIDAQAPDADFELLVELCTCDFLGERLLTSEGSISLIEPSQSPHTLSIGAVHHARCAPSLCPDGQLLIYSSKGPTAHGLQKPDFVATTHVSTSSYGDYTGDQGSKNSGFTGTSAATPHGAGVVALVRQAFPEFSSAQVTAFLAERSEDLGTPGIDNAYGAGLMLLGQPPLAQDTTPPATPQSLEISPDGWSNAPTFTVSWVAASGDDDVVAAWYKLGDAPVNAQDGTRVDTTAFEVRVEAQGETPLHVWLEDAQGNASPLNAATAVLRHDTEAPVGTLALVDGPITTRREVALRLTATDALSGVGQMRLREGDGPWGEWVAFVPDVSFSLSDGFGPKTLFAQFRDTAQNVSEPVSVAGSFILEARIDASGLANRALSVAFPRDVLSQLPSGVVTFQISELAQTVLAAAGLLLDPESGVIGGTPTHSGALEIEVEVFNDDGLVAVVTVALQLERVVVPLASAEIVEGQVPGGAVSDAYRIEVPAHTQRLTVKARSLDGGDVDVFVQRGAPFDSLDDLGGAEVASRSPGAVEGVSISFPQSETYYIAVVNRERAPQSVTLAAVVEPGYAPVLETIELGLPLRGEVGAGAIPLGEVQFSIAVGPNATALSVLLKSLGPGALRIHVRFGEPVDWRDGAVVSDWRSDARGESESLALMGQTLRAGTYYVAIENLEPFPQGFELTVSTESAPRS